MEVAKTGVAYRRAISVKRTTLQRWYSLLRERNPVSAQLAGK
jgi:hypothetical protein